MGDQFKKNRNFLVFICFLFVSFVYFGKPIISQELLAFADSFFQDYPLRVYYSQNFIKNSEFHLWLPYECLGLPFLGLIHAGIFYPFNWLYLIIPANIIFNFNFVIHYVLTAFFVYTYSRLIGLKSFPAFIAGLTFSFSGYLLGYVKSFTSLRESVTWFPLILCLYELLCRERNIRFAFLASLAIAIQIFAGHYQICIYTYVVIAIIVFFYFRKEKKDKRLNLLLLSILPICLGSLIAFPQIYSTKELADLSWRSVLGYENYFAQGSLNPKFLLVWFVPFIGESWNFSWPMSEVTLSPILLFTHILAIWFLFKNKVKDFYARMWFIISIVTLILALGKYNPLHQTLFYVPVYNLFRVPIRYLFIYSFAVSILSAMSLNRLLYSSNEKDINSLLWIILNFTIFVIFVSVFIFIFPGLLSESDYKVFQVLKIDYFRLILVGISLILFILWLVIFKKIINNSLVILTKKNFLWISYCLILIIIVSNGYFLDRFRSYFLYEFKHGNPKIEYVNSLLYDSVFEFIKANSSHERSVFLVSDSNLFNVPAKVQTINAYEPLIDKNFVELFYYQSLRTSDNWLYLLRNNLLLSMMNTRYIVVPKKELDSYRVLEELRTVPKSQSDTYLQLDEWKMINAKKMKNGEFELKSPDGYSVSMLNQKIRLIPNKLYLLSISVKSTNKNLNEPLIFDLYGGPIYDRPEQELQVSSEEITSNYRVFYKLINTGFDIPPIVDIRVFTFSEYPLLVKDIVIKEIFPSRYMSTENRVEDGNILYNKVFENDEWIVYENKNCMDRVFSVLSVKAFNDIKEFRNCLENYCFNPEETAYLSIEDFHRIPKREFTKGEVRIKSYDTDRIVVSAKFMNGPGFIILSDKFFSGWKAYLDGKEIPIYRVNFLVRGVIVSKGIHTIEFVYRPLAIYFAIFIGLTTFIFVLYVLFFYNRDKE